MGVEAELVYELGIDLPERPTPYSAAEVLAAMSAGARPTAGPNVVELKGQS